MAKIKSWENKYKTIDEELGKGGNATVIKVKNIENGEVVALKPFYNVKDSDKKLRFKNEIEVVVEFQSTIPGIIPIKDYEINMQDDYYWYTMPIAKKIQDAIKEKNGDYRFIIIGVIQLAETLSQLHQNGVSHRDIKPDNIYLFNERFSIGDFGLANFLNHQTSITQDDRPIGPFNTMAPEMRRYPKEADGTKADVYSLAKTLWIFLSEEEKGFDGVYDFRDPVISLRSCESLSKIHIVELENLLTDATDNDPTKRPTMEQFKCSLQKWLNMNPENFYSEEIQVSEWKFVYKLLFGTQNSNIPEIVIWEDLEIIHNILSTISSLPALNHSLFTDGGGLDLISVEKANEEGCLYLCFGNDGDKYETSIVSPKKLIFNTFANNEEWNYFLLELNELQPILKIQDFISFEVLVEDRPAHYVSAEDAIYRVYDYETGEKLPDGWKLVNRVVQGKILICLKCGPYNMIDATYDGRHSQVNSEQFRNYIQNIIQVSRKACKNGLSLEQFLNQPGIYENPFDTSSNSTNKKYFTSINNNAGIFIQENIEKWDFKDCLEFENVNDDKTKYYLEYNRSAFIFDTGDKTKYNIYVLCKDGRFKCKNTASYDEIYFVDSVSDIQQLYDSIYKLIEKTYSECGYHSNGFDIFLRIKEYIVAIPKYLFSKEDVYTILKNADDRERNILVVNDTGRLEIIHDQSVAHLYPVRHGTWEPRGNYVGKFANLSETYIEKIYLQMLQGWLLYLEHGEKIYTNNLHNHPSEETIINGLNKFYK